jgi:hypothetical protein
LKQSDPNNQSKLAKNNHTPQTGKQEARQKQKQQTKTTKHTIEFSNNTPVKQATLPLYSHMVRDVKPRPPV